MPIRRSDEIAWFLPYWSLRDVLIKNSPKLAEDAILAYARDLQLELPAFRACLETGKYRPAVEKDAHVAEALSISGTPTFILGETTKDGVDGTILVGAQPYSVFDAKLQEFLN